MAALAAQPLSSPGKAAEELAGTRSPEWLDAFTEALLRQRSGGELRRILQVWDLSQSEAARKFGVSRQSVAKWISAGVPASRHEMVADLSAATDLLVHYLKSDRIPAVVRRAAGSLRGRSLVDLLESGDHEGILESCRSMFDFSQAQG